MTKAYDRTREEWLAAGSTLVTPPNRTTSPVTKNTSLPLDVTK